MNTISPQQRLLLVGFWEGSEQVTKATITPTEVAKHLGWSPTLVSGQCGRLKALGLLKAIQGSVSIDGKIDKRQSSCFLPDRFLANGLRAIYDPERWKILYHSGIIGQELMQNEPVHNLFINNLLENINYLTP